MPLRSDVRKMRTANLAEKLLERGHKVFWWASAFEHQRKIMVSDRDRNFDISGTYTIRTLRGLRYQKNFSFGRYIDHQILAFKFRMQSKKCPKPDVIVASMPDYLIAYEAAQYAMKSGIPYIVDIRDLWPDVFLNRLKKFGLYNFGKISLALDFAKLNFLLKNADSLLAVSKGYLDWGLKRSERFRGPLDEIFYLGYKNSNTNTQIAAFESLEVCDWLKEREGQKMFIFIGTFGASYELDLILAAAKHFYRLNRRDICFILVGTGEKFLSINEKAATLENVVVTGWLGNQEINAILKKGYAGLLSYTKDASQGLPNKPFEYLSAGLPLINSLEGEMSELIIQYGIGLNYVPGDLESLNTCIESLLDDPGSYEAMSANALRFFGQHCDADKIYAAYARHTERLFDCRQKENIEVCSCQGGKHERYFGSKKTFRRN